MLAIGVPLCVVVSVPRSRLVESEENAAGHSMNVAETLDYSAAKWVMVLVLGASVSFVAFFINLCVENINGTNLHHTISLLSADRSSRRGSHSAAPMVLPASSATELPSKHRFGMWQQSRATARLPRCGSRVVPQGEFRLAASLWYWVVQALSGVPPVRQLRHRPHHRFSRAMRLCGPSCIGVRHS